MLNGTLSIGSIPLDDIWSSIISGSLLNGWPVIRILVSPLVIPSTVPDGPIHLSSLISCHGRVSPRSPKWSSINSQYSTRRRLADGYCGLPAIPCGWVSLSVLAGVRAAAPIPPPCNHSRSLERGVAGYCGSSAASSDTNLLLSGPGIVGGVPLQLRSLSRSSITAGLSA